MARSLRGERLPERLLSPAELEAALAERPEWLLSGDGTAIVKTFTFADFSAAFSFMTRVAMIAERMDHHPDWSNSWSKVVIRLSTHSAKGLTAADLEFAGAVDHVLP